VVTKPSSSGSAAGFFGAPVRGTFRGHTGVMELAEMLGEELPERRAFEYTYVAAEGKIALLEWAYDDAHVSVSDGADSYLIEDGKIVAQAIHYTVVSTGPVSCAR
jgi:hypothetical protein